MDLLDTQEPFRLPSSIREAAVKNAEDLLTPDVCTRLDKIYQVACPGCGDTSCVPHPSGESFLGNCLSCGAIFSPDTGLIHNLNREDY